MSDLVYFGGAVIPRERATLSIDDRGFLFADAVYEVIRVIDGRMIEAERHLARLEHSLRETSLQAPAMDPIEVAADLLRRNGLTEGQATVYLQVSRGVAARQHAFPPPGTPPTVLLTVSRFTPRPELWAEGAKAITLPDLRWSRCDIKSVNLLPNVMAAQRASEAGAYEAILVRNGVVTEATRSNVAAVVDGVIRTHPTGPFILPGVTRHLVLELARTAGIPLREQPVRAEELAAAQEVFITGTTADVMPIVAIDGRRVGDGRPGEVSRRLGALLADRIGVPALAS